MNEINIHVTQEDIDNGEQKNIHGCAIARALKSAFKTEDVIVSSSLIRIDDKSYPTPLIAKDFVCKFDTDKFLVSPITFVLSPYVIGSAYGPMLGINGMQQMVNESVAQMHLNDK